MNSTFSLLLVFLARFFMPQHNAQMRLLKADANATPIQAISDSGFSCYLTKSYKKFTKRAQS